MSAGPVVSATTPSGNSIERETMPARVQPGEAPRMGTVYDRGLFRAALIAAGVAAVTGLILVLVADGPAANIGAILLVLGGLGCASGVVTLLVERRRAEAVKRPGYYAGPRHAGWDRDED
jgi:hypothetical protein